MFTHLHAPLHGVTATHAELNTALHFGEDSVEFTEAYPLEVRTDLRMRPSWRYRSGKGARVDSRGRLVSRDVALMSHRKTTRLAHSGSYRGAREASPVKYAPERWTVWNVITTDELPFFVCVIGLHTHALVENAGDSATSSQRVTQYRMQMLRLTHTVRWARSRGWVPLVSGDLNYHDGDPDVTHSPRHVFDRLGMNTWVDGVDWMAWGDRLHMEEHHIIPRSRNGQDHPWMLARFDPRGPST